MPRYLILFNFTERGIGAVQDSPARAKKFQAAIESAGGKIEAAYWAMGPYDGLLIFQAPDDATATALAAGAGRQGFVRTQTIRLFDAEEFSKIVAKIK